ncbi:hypothetical protein PV334_21280 [Streptomyces sp. ME02-7008A-1]|uniref:hypothetical protein n=1 Tax=unclassified Streptomyces TaxID=2593676 RepID=UPI0029B52687|nr:MULTISPECIES: hypothetical protein [unclassified Streptomyces]MDX3183784.1 hypothetical protein [Streptomyces sp. ME02-7008A-1]MDX3304236.1 hypothetical protein [Streptomyces sp. ME02-7008A]
MADDRVTGPPPERAEGALVDRLKERIYATITMIAVVVGLSWARWEPRAPWPPS